MLKYNIRFKIKINDISSSASHEIIITDMINKIKRQILKELYSNIQNIYFVI